MNHHSILIQILGFAWLSLWAGCQNTTEEDTTEYVQAKSVEVSDKLSLTGVIRAGQALEISPEITGQILEILVQDKDSVTQDQVLFRVLPEEFLKDADSLRNLLNQAKNEVIRKKQASEEAKNNFLIAKKSASTSLPQVEQAYQAQAKLLEKARFKVINLEDALQILQENTVPLEILAPQSGVIQKINISSNERVFKTDSTGTQIAKVWAELIRAGQFEFEAETDNSAVSWLQKGDSAQVELAFENVKFEGMIQNISSLPKSKYQLIITLIPTNSDTSVRSGMTATGQVKIPSRQVLFLPVSYIVQTQEETFVYLKNEKGEPLKQPVKAGIQRGDNLEIIEGVTATDWVLQNPQTTTP